MFAFEKTDDELVKFRDLLWGSYFRWTVVAHGTVCIKVDTNTYLRLGEGLFTSTLQDVRGLNMEAGCLRLRAVEQGNV